MTAPKVINLALTLSGNWKQFPDGEGIRYIRADAPELVALVELMGVFCDAADEADEWDADDNNAAPVSVGLCREARDAIAAWEAMK